MHNTLTYIQSKNFGWTDVFVGTNSQGIAAHKDKQLPFQAADIGYAAGNQSAGIAFWVAMMHQLIEADPSHFVFSTDPDHQTFGAHTAETWHRAFVCLKGYAQLFSKKA